MRNRTHQRIYRKNVVQPQKTLVQNGLLLLYDELIDSLLKCDVAIGQEDWNLLEESAGRCIEILRYMDDTLDYQNPISLELHRLYDFHIYHYNEHKMLS